MNTALRKRISAKVAKRLRIRKRVTIVPLTCEGFSYNTYMGSSFTYNVYLDSFRRWQDEMAKSIMGQIGIPKHIYLGSNIS